VTTSIYFRQRGFPAYGYSPIPMNITDQARRHSNDERVFLRDYLNGVALYSQVLTAIALDLPAQ
jgi:acetylornithine deacetylase/succinyl-diaminopimelate desuccinylase-like protein